VSFSNSNRAVGVSVEINIGDPSMKLKCNWLGGKKFGG